MYEHFKHQFIASISTNFSINDLEFISKEMDKIAYDYDIKKKETSVVVYNSELPEMAKTFLVCKKIEGLSKDTLYNYKLILEKFFLATQKTPEQIIPNDIRIYLYKYQETRKISNRSLDKVRQALSSFFVWANGEGYLSNNPMSIIKPIKFEKKPRVSLSQIDLEYLRQSCITYKEKAIIEFLYSTGCRLSELINVKKTDIDWNKKTVLILGKGLKYRTTYINAKAEIALMNYFKSRNDDNEHVFVSDRKPHGQMHKSGISKIIRLLSQRNLEYVDKPITPHIFRHTTATTALNNGMPIEDISKLLGHENISTTMIYAKASNDKVQSEHKKYVI